MGSTGAYCWGANGLGQLGDGTSTQRTAPVQVIMLSPGPPTGVTATAADTTAAISWTAPATLGTGTLTGYTATADAGRRQLFRDYDELHDHRADRRHGVLGYRRHPHHGR